MWRLPFHWHRKKRCNMSFLYAWCQYVCNVFKFITIQKSDPNSSNAWSCERRGKLFNNPFLISVCLIIRCVMRMATLCTLDSALDEKGGLITKHRHMHSHCLRASRQHQFSSSLEAVFETSISCTLIHTTQYHFWHSRRVHSQESNFLQEVDIIHSRHVKIVWDSSEEQLRGGSIISLVQSSTLKKQKEQHTHVISLHRLCWV